MGAERDPIEQLIDLVIFAPLGMVLAVRQRLTELAAEGRRHLEQQVRLARLLGKLAVAIGRQRLTQQARDLLGCSSPATPPTTRPRPTQLANHVGAVDVPAAEDLPLAGYDTLAASQVVARLADLTPAELDLVRRYEEATRRRRTVLGRIDQLQRADAPKALT